MNDANLSIPFTQYLRPNGRSITIEIERPEPVARMALQLIDEGYAFEAEMLTNGMASLTFVGIRPETNEIDDLAVEIVTNGSDITDAVDRLINRACMIRAEHQMEKTDG